MAANQQVKCETGQPARVTLLGASEVDCLGQVASVSGASMRLLLDRAVPHGAAVRVEWDDTLVLGEVCDCGAAGAQFSVGLNLEHSLLHTEQLARLARTLLEQTPKAPAVGRRGPISKGRES
jgi:hypothetical protein